MSSGIANVLVPGMVRDMLESLSGPKEHAAFDATALRMRSAPAREVLAWRASNGDAGLDAVLSIAHGAMRDPLSPEADRWRSFDPAVAARLARLFAMQDIFAGDRRDAHAIYQAIMKVHGPGHLPRRHVNSALQLALCLGDHAAAIVLLELLPNEGYEHRFALCDLANPFSDSPHASMERWLARINQILWERHVEPVGVASTVPSPFDGLACDLAAGTIDGPLVTITISSWRPDASLISAVGSIVNQTWRNLEILLVDDGSPAEYDEILARAVDLDPGRIRLLRQERNGGTYVARNRALAEATGAYFTVHDSDDWAHPSRIERQVAMLRADEALVANYCTGLRADDDLLVSLPGVPAFRTNESSLLFRREPVMAAIGYYDPSRKGADTEFSTRLRLHFGEQRIAVLPDILTFIRLSKGSLSRAELRPGWRHPARAMYRRSFEAWHGRNSNITIRTPDPAMEKFPRPARFQSFTRQGAEFDIAYLGDYRMSSPGGEQLADDIAVLTEAHARVAIIQQDLFTNLSPLAVEPYSVPLQDLLNRRAIEEIDLGGSASVRTLVVTQPALMSYMTRLRTSLAVDRVLLLEEYPSKGDTCHAHDRGLSEQACKAIFGVDPQWISRAAGDATSELAARTWPPAVSIRHWRAPARDGDESREPVLGIELPGRGRLQPWLDRVAGLQARPVLAWRGADVGTPAGLPRTWILYERANAPKPTFLALIDFWIDPTPPDGESTPSLSVLQAMAAGCIPILDPGWRLQFGQAAVYAAPSHLARVIQTLGSSPQLRRRTLEHGPAFVDQHAGPAAFGNRVRALFN